MASALKRGGGGFCKSGEGVNQVLFGSNTHLNLSRAVWLATIITDVTTSSNDYFVSVKNVNKFVSVISLLLLTAINIVALVTLLQLVPNLLVTSGPYKKLLILKDIKKIPSPEFLAKIVKKS